MAALDMQTQARLMHEVDRGLRADAILFSERLELFSDEVLYDVCVRPVLSPPIIPAHALRGQDDPGEDLVPHLVAYEFVYHVRSESVEADPRAVADYTKELQLVHAWAHSLFEVKRGAVFRTTLDGPSGPIPLIGIGEEAASGEIVRIRGARLRPHAIARLIVPEAFVRLRESLRNSASEFEQLETVFGLRIESPDTSIVLKALDVQLPSDAVDTYLHSYHLGGLVSGWMLEVSFLNELKSAGLRRLLSSLIPLAIGISGILFLAGLAMREMEASRIKSAFVSNTSHELKTPIAKIQFFNEMLQSLPADASEKKGRYHEVIARECKRLKLLVENVLDISRVEEGRLRYTFSVVPIQELVHEVADTADLMYEEDGYRIEVEAEEDLPSVRIDPQAIRQVLLNLLDNAVKYSNPHTIQVRVFRTRLHGNEAIGVTVKDRGIGIPPSKTRHIFEEFYRIAEGGERHVSGTGLGLALVRHIVSAHGGVVQVQSREGQGSSFTMSLPLMSVREAKSR